MTRPPPHSIGFVETVRLTGTRRDGSPLLGCHGDFFASWARWPGTGVALLIGLTPMNAERSAGPAPAPPSPAASAASSGAER